MRAMPVNIASRKHASHRYFGVAFIVLFTFSSILWSCTTIAGTKRGPSASAFDNARQAYRSFLRHPSWKKYRSSWINVITAYRKVYVAYPRTPYAPRALYMVGKLYRGLYGYSKNRRDLKAAEDYFRAVIKRYPLNYLADDAQFKIAEIYEIERGNKDRACTEYSKVIRDYPNGDMKKIAFRKLARLQEKKPKAVPSKPAKVSKTQNTTTVKPVLVKGIRHWSSRDYTRVVIDLAHPTQYTQKMLPEDKKHLKPVRLCVDLKNSYITNASKDSITIEDGLLKRVRVAQYRKDTVRVVLDVVSLQDYKIFTLKDPFRIVIDALGNHRKISRQEPVVTIPDKIPNARLVRQLGLGIKRIVIDPGHGGRDSGAIGYRHIKEKKVVLEIAKRLKEEITRRHPHIKVLLTRYSDHFIPLEERTAIANTKRADLFISIHANAHRNRHVAGIETFFLNFATDDEAVRVAALENATSRKSISDLQSILHHLMLNSKIAESSNLAQCIQEKLVKRLRSRYRHVNDHGVKQAPFYVLIGAKMPAVLVETSYISNPTEAKRLKSPRYQRAVAKGIADGIDEYLAELHVHALGGRNR